MTPPLQLLLVLKSMRNIRFKVQHIGCRAHAVAASSSKTHGGEPEGAAESQAQDADSVMPGECCRWWSL